LHAFEQERSRIARDIHDDLGSSLTNIALLSELALGDLEPEENARQHLDEIFTAAQRIARSVDEIVWAINPKNDPVEMSLAYICKSAQDFLRPSGVQCRLDLPEEFPACFLTASERHNLYLTVREGLNNVVKHAGARDVKLSLRVEDHALVVVLADNGRGFDVAQTAGASLRHGLGNMAKRMEMVGGRFELTSQPGHGTTLRLVVPLSARPNDLETPRALAG
jgi:signal transduction histidine kinase